MKKRAEFMKKRAGMSYISANSIAKILEQKNVFISDPKTDNNKLLTAEQYVSEEK